MDLHERGPLAEHGEDVPLALEEGPVRGPRRRQRLLGVVKQVDVAREPRCREQRVERGSPRDIALAAAKAVVG
jgi:hypothetical protein